MKRLLITLIALSLFSCKKEEINSYDVYVEIHNNTPHQYHIFKNWDSYDVVKVDSSLIYVYESPLKSGESISVVADTPDSNYVSIEIKLRKDSSTVFRSYGIPASRIVKYTFL